ncbi:MAG: NEW3 domain-containing protein [Candidatus Altiarchaeota archaeon]
MLDRKIGLLSLLFAISLVPQVSAARIQMGVSLVPEDNISSESFTMDLTILNSGDEAAREVTVSLLLPGGFSADDIYAGTMEPGRPFHGTFEVRVPGSVNPGLYPVVLKTHYTDANAYPFSTVSPSFIKYRSSAPVMTRGRIGNLTLAGQGEKNLLVEFDNLDEKPHSVLITVRIPDEIKAREYSKHVSIGAKETGEASFPLKSFGALPGSIYYVFAQAEYDDGGLHYSSIAQGRVDIVSEEERGLEAPPWLFAAVLALLIIAAAYMQVRK